MRAWWFVRRPHTLGVKCAVRDAGGRIVFVRHAYGDRRAWELPGGHLRRREDPEAAMRREMREELGVELDDVRAIGRVEVAGSHKRTTLHVFAASPAPGAVLRPDAGELAEVRWARPERPPRPLGPDAVTLLELLAGGPKPGDQPWR
jgi:8-oxo-dGTP pyrophosphatase MutT (NUDIX family)